MMKPLFTASLVALLFVSAFGPATASEDYLIVRGARLYDDWAAESHNPSARPGRAAAYGRKRASSASTPASCRDCHGADYRGTQGFVGVVGQAGRDPRAIVEVLKNPTHGYGEVLNDDDLMALALFLSKGQVDAKAVIETFKKTKFDPQTYESLYGNVCGGCHGQDGRRMRAIPALGDVARQHPEEALRTILFGHSGQDMPALLSFGNDNAVALLTHLQTLPSTNLSVSIARGGRLYDDWQLDEGARQQVIPHPSYPVSSAGTTKSAAATWRCKTCHGADYKGNQGELASAANSVGTVGIQKMIGADPNTIAGVLQNKTHQYGAVLKGPDLIDLANFVSAGQVDMDLVIDKKTRLFRGDASRGEHLYQTVCAGCHGENGKGVTASLNRLVKRNPYGSLHLILNGHPGEAMPALRDMKLDTSADILTYVQGMK